MGYYEKVFSKVDFRILIVITPLLGLLLLPAALNIPLGIDFTGGTELQVLTDRSLSGSGVTEAFSICSEDIDANVRTFDGRSSLILRSKDVLEKDCIDEALLSLGFLEEETEGIFPSIFKPELGSVLIEQGSNVMIIAGILMTLIVFIAFRSLIPSVAVIQAAVFDILIALGILSLAGFELNLAGVAALLMLIGYSIDTDIMLTSKILKQGSKPFSENANQAFTTGITMTGTTLAAMSAIFVVILFIRMDTITQIASVILAGLVADIPTTWLTNLAILKWYSDRPGGKTSGKFNFSLFRS